MALMIVFLETKFGHMPERQRLGSQQQGEKQRSGMGFHNQGQVNVAASFLKGVPVVNICQPKLMSSWPARRLWGTLCRL